MNKTITWFDVYEDFKRRHPRLSKEVSQWSPYDYLTILVCFKDGMKVIFNYDEHIATILQRSI